MSVLSKPLGLRLPRVRFSNAKELQYVTVCSSTPLRSRFAQDDTFASTEHTSAQNMPTRGGENLRLCRSYLKHQNFGDGRGFERIV